MIEQYQELSKLDNTSGDFNPYRELTVNNAEKIDTCISQMEQWSILGNVIKYIQYDKHPKNFHNLNISTVHKESSKGNSNIEIEERHMLELDFGDTQEKLKGEYLDMYKGIQSEILSTNRFDENSDLSTTYLERRYLIKNSSINAEESFQMSEQGYKMGKIIRWNRVPGTVRYRS